MRGGLLPFNKPAGPSSAMLVGRVKRLTGAKRIGHTGTLDPAAEGLLVLAFERATSLIPYLPTDKTYQAVIRLGRTTDTLDAQGTTVVEQIVPELGRDRLLAVLDRFRGPQLQIPPMVSALHHQGKRLYHLARQGVHVERQPRRIVIHTLRFLGYHKPDLEIEVACSSGTYIRALAADIGETLGCGAHLHHLVRTACNGFELAQALNWDDLEREYQAQTWQQRLLGPRVALRHLPGFQVSGLEQAAVQNGRPVDLGDRNPGPGRVKITDQEGHVLAIAQPQDGQLKLERVLCPANEAQA